MTWQVEFCMCLGRLSLDVKLVGDTRPVALIGSNGSGKTTVLRTIAGAYDPDAGYIRIGKNVLFDSHNQVNLAPEKRGIGYVPQGYGLFPHLCVLENVLFGAHQRTQHTTKAGRKKAAYAFLEQMGCAHLAKQAPCSLSGGEQQRVALARALFANPKILLLDEPLSALDTQSRRDVRVYLSRHLALRNHPAIVITHDVRDILALNATVWVMEQGTIVQSGSIEKLASEPATEFVAEFFEPLQRRSQHQEPTIKLPVRSFG